MVFESETSEVLLELSRIEVFHWISPACEGHDLTSNDGRSKALTGTASESFYITVHHSRITSLELVGLQMWSGSFLLADYLIANRDSLRDKVVMELGAGCGFCGVILSLLNHKGAFVTDFSPDIMDLVRQNIALNRHLPAQCMQLNSDDCISHEVRALVLDWFDLGSACRPLAVGPEVHVGDAVWSAADQALLASHEVVFLAADVIYDDLLTEAFFLKLSQIIRSGEKLILTLEKRTNFSLAEREVVVHGYELFLRIIGHSSQTASGSLRRDFSISKHIKRFGGVRVDCAAIPQSVASYRRDEQSMELWEITCLE